ncbi:MAG: GNAT family N-acetyltransferase [Bacilli bacterium]|nr:GNAT family N-acetyltransferase [Bacilli bacterium]
MEFKKETLTDDVIEQLISLSKEWVEEDCCFGMVANTRDDLKEPLFVAVEDNIIVGYIFGHYYEQEKKTSYIEIGEKCFDVDELYVKKEYRDQGIGRILFNVMELEVKDKCKYITLATSNKDYKKVLKFYTEIEDMTFHSAFLIKEMK